MGAHLALAGVVWLMPAMGSAWVPLEYRWRVLPVVFHLDTTRVGGAAGGPGLASAESTLNDAINQWNRVGSDFRASYGGHVSGGSRPNGRNEVYWLRTWDPALGDPNTVLAVCAASTRSSGEPVRTTVESDIVYNGEAYRWDGVRPRRRDGGLILLSMLGTTLHEVGHSLGLGHSDVEAAVMRSRRRTDYRSPQADDRAGAVAIYPPGGPLCTADRQCPRHGTERTRCGSSGTCELVPRSELGGLCGSAAICADALICRGQGGSNRCSRPCTLTDAEPCGGGTLCISGWCWPPGDTEDGGTCRSDSDCRSTVCSGGTCRQLCDDDCSCAFGEVCVPASTRERAHCRSGASTCVRCGDGLVGGTEACDDGIANDDTVPDRCRTDCTAPGCGDGVVDTGEACDDGDANSDATPGACRTDCRAAYCGDGVVDVGETCDDGTDNADDVPDRCRLDCRPARCGDSVLDTDEDCDDGNAEDGDGCPATCTLDPMAPGHEGMRPPMDGPDGDVGDADGGVTGDAGHPRSPELIGTCTCRIHPQSGTSPIVLGLMVIGWIVSRRRRP